MLRRSAIMLLVATLVGLVAMPATAQVGIGRSLQECAGDESAGAFLRNLRLLLTEHGVRMSPPYNVIVGTEGDDQIPSTQKRDLICGLEGRDRVADETPLEDGDIFVGGAGNDSAGTLYGGVFVGGTGEDGGNVSDGVFIGGPGDDSGYAVSGGKYYGGDGSEFLGGGVEGDGVFYGQGDADAVDWQQDQGRFYGGEGDDISVDLAGGTFVGGPGDDYVEFLGNYDPDFPDVATFYGGDGNDMVRFLFWNGVFDGGAGYDIVRWIVPPGGSCDDVEECSDVCDADAGCPLYWSQAN